MPDRYDIAPTNAAHLERAAHLYRGGLLNLEQIAGILNADEAFARSVSARLDHQELAPQE